MVLKIDDNARWMVWGYQGEWVTQRNWDIFSAKWFDTWHDAYQYAYSQAKLAVTEVP